MKVSTTRKILDNLIGETFIIQYLGHYTGTGAALKLARTAAGVYFGELVTDGYNEYKKATLKKETDIEYEKAYPGKLMTPQVAKECLERKQTIENTYGTGGYGSQALGKVLASQNRTDEHQTAQVRAVSVAKGVESVSKAWRWWL